MELCEVQALENLNRQPGDPHLGVGVEHLMGTGAFATPETQARLVPDILRESARLALRAFATILEMGRKPVSFTAIRQGKDEPYMQFIDPLREAVDRQFDHPEAKKSLLRKLANENWNVDCRKVLLSMPKSATLIEMVEAGGCIGSLEQQQTMLAGVFATAMQPLETTNKRCYACGKLGHLSFQCPKGKAAKSKEQSDQVPGLCPRCQKGRQYANQCQSKYDREGKPLDQGWGNRKRSAGQGRATTQMPLNLVSGHPSLNNNLQGAWTSSPQKLVEVPEWM